MAKLIVPRIRSEKDFPPALKALVAADPRLSDIIAVAGPPPLRLRPGGFAGLAWIVVSQQVSTASAEAIFARLVRTIELEAGRLRRCRVTTLQKAGLSGPKIRALKAIATAIDTGALDLDALVECPADEAHAALTAVHGIGPWTADIYLLFCLGHADAWPAGDLALQEAARLAFALQARPSAKELVIMAEAWRPWRGVVARLLWSYYREVKMKPRAV